MGGINKYANEYHARSSISGTLHTKECLNLADVHDFIADGPYVCFCPEGNKFKEMKTTPRNPAYVSLIHKMLETHEIKSHDYADDNNPFSNFEFAAQIAKGFNDEVDKVFATLIGVKLARLQQLLNGKSPKNESIDDTFLDQTNYSAIWASYRMKRG